MDDKSDTSDSDSESLPQGTIGCSRKPIKRTANWESEIAGKKRRKKCSRISEDEPPKQLRSHSNLQIYPDGNGGSFQNPLSTVSDNLQSSTQILPGESERLFKDPHSAVSDILLNILGDPNYDDLLFNDPPPTVSGTSASFPSNDLISFRNLRQVIHGTDPLLQDQPKSIVNTDASSRKKKFRFKPSYVFRNLLYTANDNEADEFSCEERIFQPNFPVHLLLKDQPILGDIRNVFEKEGKLKDSASQIETLNVHQIVDKDLFQSPSDQDNQNCYDWDKFLERWEGIDLISESISEVQGREQKAMEESELCLPASSTSSTSTKRKSAGTSQPPFFNGKRPCVADSLGTSISASLELTSFQREMEMIVRPATSDVLWTSTASKLKKFAENTKIKHSGNSPTEQQTFYEKVYSIHHASLPNRTNGSFLSNDSYNEILQVDEKGITDLLKNRIRIFNVNSSGGTNNSTGKNEELTGVEGCSSILDDEEMVS